MAEISVTTRAGREKKESTASLVSAVLKDILTDKQFLDLVSNHIDSQLAKLQTSLEVQEAKIMELEVQDGKKSQDIKRLKSELDRKDDQITKLQNDVHKQEQYSRRNCLRFFGIAETKDEDTDVKVLQLANESLGVKLTKDDLERSHRVKSKANATHTENTKSRPIIAKFVSYRKRTEILRSRRKLAGSRKSIQEDLTSENARLLKKTRDCSKIKAAWTRDGRIIALIPATNNREITKVISCEEDLDLI